MPDKFRLWLDGQCFQTGSRSRGIGRYIEGFIRGIIDHAPHVDLHISLNAGMPQEAVAARDFLSKWIKADNIHVWHGTAEQGEAIEGLADKRRLSEIALAYHVACIAPDLALSSSPFEGAYDRAVPLLPNDISGMPIASIFYDAIPFRFSDRYLSDQQANQYYQRRLAAFKNFDLNLCISSFAQQELASILQVDRSVNIEAGISDRFLNIPARADSKSTEPNTLLYVGGFDWRKNVPSVIEAIGLLKEEQKSVIKFLVVGDLDVYARADLERKWADLHLPSDHLRLIGHVSDDALLAYYRSVSAVIQPSLMEGFGLTALEAILCGAPVIASNTGALPEVIVDEAHLFDPTNAADMSRHIAHVLTLDGVPTLSPEAIRNARKFSWERTATTAVEALARAAPRERKSLTKQQEADLSIKALRAVDELKLPKDLIIGCLARSDLRKAEEARLIIEATTTVISDGGSGIQRVVKKICSSMVPDDDASLTIGFSDNDSEWFEVKERRLTGGADETKNNGDRIFFTPKDHILMLDSSWTLHPVHSQSLMNARLRGAKVTTCLYDTVPLRASGFTHSGMPPVFSLWLQAALTYSTGFVCISKAVADEFIEILRQLRFPRPLNIGYWPLGADFGATHIADAKRDPDSEALNFLMVGTLEPRKGYGVALDAFDLLWEQNINVKLTIVGKMGWNVGRFVRRLEKHPQWGQRLFWRRNTSDTELGQEYANADCLIASSFAEGFGLPIVEAGYFGKPIIASDIPVFREVSARSVASRFFSVGDPLSLADSIRSFVESGQSGAAIPQNNQPWENWQQSAARLKEVLLQEKWYCRYIPEDGSAFNNPAAIGTFSMSKPLSDAECSHSMHLVDGPLSADGADAQKFVVSISNRSEQLWSSKGSDNGRLGVFLSCRLFDASGKLIREGHRTAIPLIIGPGDTVYMPIEVSNAWLHDQDAVVHIELVQEGINWWGDPIVLAVNQIPAPTACA